MTKERSEGLWAKLGSAQQGMEHSWRRSHAVGPYLGSPRAILDDWDVDKAAWHQAGCEALESSEKLSCTHIMKKGAIEGRLEHTKLLV